MKHFALALVGFGHVGRAFAELLLDSRAMLARRYGLECTVVGVATRRHGAAVNKLGLDLNALLAADPDDSLERFHCCPSVGDTLAFIRGAEPDVMIETSVLDARTGHPAIDHVRAALEADAHVITANKGPVAFAYRDLRGLARARGRAFRFEGTVMDGTPVFNLVAEMLPGCEILGFRGVINSTTNYILSVMEEGVGFDRALANARTLGVVEADETNDVDGLDAAVKTAALVNVLMDGAITPKEVETTGIRGLSVADMHRATERRQSIRLVASADRHDDQTVVATVAPESLPEEDLLARLRGTSNALILRTDLMGEIAIVEHDPGIAQTAYALLSDLIAIARQ